MRFIILFSLLLLLFTGLGLYLFGVNSEYNFDFTTKEEFFAKSDDVNLVSGAVDRVQGSNNLPIAEVESIKAIDQSSNHKNIPNETKVLLRDSTSPIICATNSEIAVVHAYGGDGKHTGLKPPPPDSDLKFFEQQIPNSQYTEFGSSSCVILGSVDIYSHIEIMVESIGQAGWSGIDIRQGNEDVYEYKQVWIEPGWRGRFTINQNYEISLIKIDFNGDGKYESEASFLPVI